MTHSTQNVGVRTVRGAVAVAVGTGLTVSAAATQAQADVAVDMARVLVAAQVEPACGQKADLGDDFSTRQVQRALSAKGFRTPADGRYGEGTTVAYGRYQRSLGARGIGANGLPGTTSLTRLGSGKFLVTHRVDRGSTNDSYGGQRVDTRTKKMLQAADDLLPKWNFHLIQGSYHPGSSKSAGTHDGGGVVDVSVNGLSAEQRWQEVKALRTVGFAAWLRTPAQHFGYHIHAVAIGDPDIYQLDGQHTARDQVCDYHAKRDGLAGHGPDNTPAKYRVKFTWWERYRGL